MKTKRVTVVAHKTECKDTKQYRTIQIFMALLERPQSIKMLSLALNIPYSTVFRITNSLCWNGYVRIFDHCICLCTKRIARFYTANPVLFIQPYRTWNQ